MPDFYRLVRSDDPNDGTTAVVLTGDDEQSTKVVSTRIPVQLNAHDRKRVEALGYGVETVSKEDAEKAEADEVVGDDVAAAAPVLGTSTKDNQK
jgi:hypothetical protein